MPFPAWDIDLLRLIHHHRPEALDGLLSVCSSATTYISIAIIILVFVQSVRLKSKDFRLKFYQLLTVFSVSALVSFLLKTFIFRVRPFITYPDIVKLSEAGSSSFPSGHTFEVFAMAFAVATLFPRKVFIIPIYLWACLIAYSRMALGVHYPLDVMAGMVFGTFVSYLCLRVFYWRNGEEAKRRRGERVMGRRGEGARGRRGD